MFSAVALISLPLLTLPVGAQTALSPEVKDVVLRVNERVEVRTENPAVVNYLLTGSNVSQVQAATYQDRTVFTFTSLDFYYLDLVLSAEDLAEPVDVTIVKVTDSGENVLGSYKIAGTLDFDVLLRITVLERPPAPGEAVPLFTGALSGDVRNALRIVLLVAPISYLGGFGVLEAYDRIREWRMGRTAGYPVGHAFMNWTRFILIIVFIVTWAMVVLLL